MLTPSKTIKSLEDGILITDDYLGFGANPIKGLFNDFLRGFSKEVFNQYSDKVKFWCTINEPGVVSMQGYFKFVVSV